MNKNIIIYSLMLFVLISSTYSAPADSISLQYNFSETSGTHVTDATGKFDGTTNNANIWSATGKIGTGIFPNNAYGAYTDVNDDTSPYLNSSKWSVSFWVYRTGSWGGKALVECHGSNANGGWIGLSNADGTTVYGGTNVGIYPSGGTATLNTWVHFTMTYDGTSIKWYRNGILNASRDGAYTPPKSYPCSVGWQPGGSSYSDHAYIDEVAIWNRSISAEEVSAVYNNESAGISYPWVIAETLTISSVANGTITNQSAEVTWNTSINANGTVNYGTTLALSSSSYNSTSSTYRGLLLTGLTNGTLYYYNVTSCAGGSCVVSGIYNFTTLQNPIYVLNENITSYNITNQSAKISWNTNTDANGTVKYGVTVGLLNTSINTTFGVFREIQLYNLTNNTLYYYNVTSCKDEACSTNGTFNFSTLNNPSLNILSVNPNTTNVTGYSTSNLTFNVSASTTDSKNITFTWFINNVLDFVENLISGATSVFNRLFDVGEYNVTVVVNSSDTNKTYTWNVNITLLLYNQTVFNISNESAKISWNTDVIANGTVNYGTTLALGTKVNNVSLLTFREIELTSLANNTLYYYNITSCKNNTCVTNGTFSFTTLEGPGNNCVDIGYTLYCQGNIPNITINSNKNITFVGVTVSRANATLSYISSENIYIYNSTFNTYGTNGTVGSDVTTSCSDAVGNNGANGGAATILFTSNNWFISENSNFTSVGGNGGNGGRGYCNCVPNGCDGTGGDGGNGGIGNLTIISKYSNFSNSKKLTIGGYGGNGGIGKVVCSSCGANTYAAYGGDSGAGKYGILFINSSISNKYYNSYISSTSGLSGSGGGVSCTPSVGCKKKIIGNRISEIKSSSSFLTNRIEFYNSNISFNNNQSTKFIILDIFKFNSGNIFMINNSIINYTKSGTSLLLDVDDITESTAFSLYTYCPSTSALVLKNDSSIDSFNTLYCTNTIGGYKINISELTPINNSILFNSTVNFSAHIISNESVNLTNASLTVYNSTGTIVNQTSWDISGTFNSFVSTLITLIDGTYTWFIEALDVFDLSSNYTGNFSVNAATPAISFTAGTDATGVINDRDDILIGISTSTMFINYTTIYLYNSSALYNSTLNSTYVNYSGLPNDEYYFNATVVGLAYQNWTETRHITLNKTRPLIILDITPEQNKTTNVAIQEFSIYFSSSSPNFGCPITIDGTRYNGQNTTKSLGSGLYNYSINVTLTAGKKYWNFTCENDASGNQTSTTRVLYVFLTHPNMTGSTFLDNKPVIWGDNLQGTWNVSDDVVLYSYNITVDEKQILYNNSLNSATNMTIGLSYITSNFTIGSHKLSLIVSDGHTSNTLEENYTIEYGGLFDDGLGFDIGDRTMRIKNVDSSMGDRWTVIKYYDRYSYVYSPVKDMKTSYEFIITSSEKIQILNAEPYQSWVVSGKNWMDFVLDNQPNEIINISRIDDKSVNVKISNLNPTEKLTFHSLGEVNTATYNYTFNSYNITVTDSQSITSGSSWHATVKFDKGNASFGIMNISRAYNNTDLNLSYGTLVYNRTIVPKYELWNISYTAPIVSGTATNWSTNYRWFIESTQQTFNSSQIISSLNIGDCSNTSWVKAVTLLLINENSTNLTEYINGTVNLYLEATPVGGAVGIQGANVSIKFEKAFNYSICIVPNASVSVGNSIIEYMAPGYSTRHYYMINQTLTNNTLNIPLYLLSNGISSVIQAKVYDKSSGDPVPGAYIELLRYYPESNSFKLVEMMQSDTNGYGTFTVALYNTLYKWIVIHNSAVKLDTETSTVYSGTKLLPISLSQDALGEFQYIGAVANNVTWDKTTNTAIFQWYDTNAVVTKGQLKVYRQNGWGKTLLSDTQLITASGILAYTVTENTTGNTYIAEGILDPVYKWPIISIMNPDYNIRSTWGDTVVLALMLLTIVLAFMFLDLGVAGVVTGSLVALGVGSFLHIISLSFMSLISLALIGGIFIARANRTQ